MKNFFSTLMFLFAFSGIQATIINVPADQPTIQAAIDAAVNGDTVLVQPGSYVENINYNGKNITVASLFLISPDPAYISQTIIDGDSITSVVTFANGEDSTAVLDGFTIVNGQGTHISIPYGGGKCGGGIYINESGPSIKNLKVKANSADFGGGIYIDYYSNPLIENVLVFANTAFVSGGGIFGNGNEYVIKNSLLFQNNARFGGGLCDENGGAFLSNVTITGNIAKEGGGIGGSTIFPNVDSVHRCNIYNNYALLGNDINISATTACIVRVDTFSVLNPTEYHAYPPENFLFDILNAKIVQADADLYVSSTGDNANSGLMVDDPLKNIRYALSKIVASDSNPHTIYVEDGIYSPGSTGEIFPLNIPDYVSLQGQSQLGTILDGEWKTALIRTISNTGTQLTNLTITHGQGGSESTGGSTAPYYWAGGITMHDNSNLLIENVSVFDNSSGMYCTSNSSPTIQNITLSGNAGMGLYLKWGCNANVSGATITNNTLGISCDASNPTLQDIAISWNTGSGISCYNSSPVLKDIIITHNTANQGGGMNLYNNCYPSLENVTIAYNSAGNKGGGICCLFAAKPVFNSDNRCNIYLNEATLGSDYYAEADQQVVVDTFTVMNPSSYYTYPLSKFSFDILNSKTTLVDADLWVSPDGDNNNSGLNQEEPLKNIDFAFSVIMADNAHQNTIHLMEGLYSTSANGEFFPLYLPDYVNLEGVSAEAVIVDAEWQSTVLIINNNQTNQVSNFTVTNGSGNNTYPMQFSGGLAISGSSPKLSDMIIRNNDGGGLSCLGSGPVLENISIINNGEVWGGGGLYIWAGSPVLKNILISGNSADELGGGIFCAQNSVPIMVNVTITNNSAQYGGGIYCSLSSGPDITNAILWNNTPEEVCFNGYHNPNSISLAYTDIQGGEAGIVTNGNGTVNWLEGNINQDPLFIDTGNHPYALTDESLCANAGTPDTTGLNLPDIDLAGNPRIFGERIDMGAYENQNVVIGITDYFPDENPGFTCLPNPFTHELTITYPLSESAYTSIEIYNSEGKKVKEFSGKLQSEGKQVCKIKTTDLPAGIYFCVLKTNEGIQTKKILKLK